MLKLLQLTVYRLSASLVQVNAMIITCDYYDY